MIVLKRYKKYCTKYIKSSPAIENRPAIINELATGYKKIIDPNRVVLLYMKYSFEVIQIVLRRTISDQNRLFILSRYIVHKMITYELRLYATDRVLDIDNFPDAYYILNAKQLKIKSRPYIQKRLYYNFKLIINKEQLAKYGIKLSFDNPFDVSRIL